MTIPTGILLESSENTNDATSYDTGTLTPDTAKVTTFIIHGSDNPAPGQPGVTGTNGWSATWNHVVTVSSSFNSASLFETVPNSITGGVVTADYSGDQSSGVIFNVTEWADADLSTPITQSDSDTATGTSTSLVLAAFGSEGAAFMSVGVSVATPDNIVHEGGSWAYLNDELGTTVPNVSSRTAQLAAEDTTPTFSWDTSSVYRGLAAEIAAAVAAGGRIMSSLAHHGGLAGMGGIAGAGGGLAA